MHTKRYVYILSGSACIRIVGRQLIGCYVALGSAVKQVSGCRDGTMLKTGDAEGTAR